MTFKEYAVQFEKTLSEERCYVLCWEGDFLKKVCVASQSLELPVPDAELVPLARIMCSLGTKQLPLSIVGGSPTLLRVLSDHRDDGRRFLVVQRFTEEVLLQSFRQAHQDVFGMLEVVTAVEHVVLRLRSVIYEDWLEDKPCLRRCIRAGAVPFADLRTVLTDLIELWPTFRPYIRYTGHPHLKEVVDRVSVFFFFSFRVFGMLTLFCHWLGICLVFYFSYVLGARYRFRVDFG